MAHGAGTPDRLILGLETSCDDTCAALVTPGGEIRSNVIASQGLLHARYGGVVPEIASRRHLELADAVVADALERAGARLDDVETVAVTHGPGPDRGAAGGALVGEGAGRDAAAAADAGRPSARARGVQHARARPIEPPYLCLVASGGHTFLARVDDPAFYTVLGQTLDDAAGEAFDKGARLLGLGYPGGPELDRLAARAIPRRSRFRAARPASSTSASRGSRRRCSTACATSPTPTGPTWPPPTSGRSSRHWSARTRAALEREGLERLAIGGGVAANSELRAAVEGLDATVWVPPMELCTDNAAMIAGAARFLEPLEYPDYLALDAAARL